EATPVSRETSADWFQRRRGRIARSRNVDVASPGRRAENAAAVAAVGIALGHVDDLLEQALLQAGRLEAELDQAAGFHHQAVLARLVARIGQMLDPRAGQP